MLVRIIKEWNWPDLRRQTPGGLGVWDGIEFTDAPGAECDYAVVLNCLKQPRAIRCPASHVWALIQEPPVGANRRLHRGQPAFHRIFTSDLQLTGPRFFHSQSGLPWFVNQSYDELLVCQPDEKDRPLSWVTSDNRHLPGHRDRMAFLQRLQQGLSFDLFGRGFHFLDDKRDGLARYRYSLAVENYRGPDYWTEKLSDCYLAWAMPIYCGCTNIDNYFPPESMVKIDISSPQAIEEIREVIASDLWLKRREAIAEARRLILNRHQLFPLLAREIRAQELSEAAARPQPELIQLEPLRESPLLVLARKILSPFRHRGKK